MPPRHFLDIDCIDAGTLRRIVDMGHAMKKAGKRVPAELRPAGIESAVLMLIFEKPSTRTRISFEVGVAELGATPIVYGFRYPALVGRRSSTPTAYRGTCGFREGALDRLLVEVGKDEPGRNQDHGDPGGPARHYRTQTRRSRPGASGLARLSDGPAQPRVAVGPAAARHRHLQA